MYAIVEIAGQQFKVQKDQQLYVHRLENKEGSKVSFDEVLLIDDNGKVEVGAPVISGAAVNAKVVRHLKGDKVLVFKKKRRKGYQKMNGHRQYLTEVMIEDISAKGGKKAAAAKPKKEEPKADAPKKAEAKKEAAHKKETAKKAAPKKAEAKKETAKKAAPKAEAKKEAPKKADDKKETKE